jgi:hypothetical protein
MFANTFKSVVCATVAVVMTAVSMWGFVDSTKSERFGGAGSVATQVAAVAVSALVR